MTTDNMRVCWWWWWLKNCSPLQQSILVTFHRENSTFLYQSNRKSSKYSASKNRRRCRWQRKTKTNATKNKSKSGDTWLMREIDRRTKNWCSIYDWIFSVHLEINFGRLPLLAFLPKQSETFPVLIVLLIIYSSDLVFFFLSPLSLCSRKCPCVLVPLLTVTSAVASSQFCFHLGVDFLQRRTFFLLVTHTLTRTGSSPRGANYYRYAMTTTRMGWQFSHSKRPPNWRLSVDTPQFLPQQALHWFYPPPSWWLRLLFSVTPPAPVSAPPSVLIITLDVAFSLLFCFVHFVFLCFSSRARDGKMAILVRQRWGKHSMIWRVLRSLFDAISFECFRAEWREIAR